MSRVRDPRIHRWPRITRSDGKVTLSTKVLPTWRMQMLTRFLFQPLTAIWKLLVFVCVIDFLLFMFTPDNMSILRPVFQKLLGSEGYAHSALYFSLIVLRLVWFYETRSGHNLTRLLFGRRLRITITPNRILAGGWIPIIRMSRDLTMTFSLQPLDNNETEIQQASQQLMLVVDDSRSVKLTSIYSPARSRQVVENANVALQVASSGEGTADLDIDPSRA